MNLKIILRTPCCLKKESNGAYEKHRQGRVQRHRHSEHPDGKERGKEHEKDSESVTTGSTQTCPPKEPHYLLVQNTGSSPTTAECQRQRQHLESSRRKMMSLTGNPPVRWATHCPHQTQWNSESRGMVFKVLKRKTTISQESAPRQLFTEGESKFPRQTRTGETVAFSVEIKWHQRSRKETHRAKLECVHKENERHKWVGPTCDSGTGGRVGGTGKFVSEKTFPPHTKRRVNKTTRIQVHTCTPLLS